MNLLKNLNHRNKMMLGFLFSGIGLVVSIYRDFFVSFQVNDISFFVTYVSLCALITTPLSERMQYGIDLNPLLVKIIIFFFVISTFANLSLLVISNNYLVNFFAFAMNVGICLSVAYIMGVLSQSESPYLIRMIGPIFPSFNIGFIYLFGINDSFSLANVSYYFLFSLVIIFFLHKRKSLKKLIQKNISNKIFLKSLIMHYLTFAVAYLFVLLNANLYFDHMFTMRIPLYIYILLSMFFPYAKYYNLKIVFSISIIVILTLIFFFLGNPAILFTQILIVMLLSFFTYKRSII